jgi:drug/metabolite transporter (DMT)-like permease
VCYSLALSRAYDRGDLSVAYPIARGAAPLLTAAGGALLLQDSLTLVQYLAISLASSGLILAGEKGASRGAIGWASLTALAVATYTRVDAGGRPNR